MALIKCPECGRDVSDNAINCPNCGYMITIVINDEEKQHESVVGIVGLIFACLGFFIPFGIVGAILSYIATARKEKSICGIVGSFVTIVNIVIWIIAARL